MTGNRPTSWLLALSSLLLAFGLSSASAQGRPSSAGQQSSNPIELKVLSSAPDQVTGGDVRIAIESPPGQRRFLELELNGVPVDLDALDAGPHRLEGVIDGLAEGDNTLSLSHARFGELENLTLVNHPITGPVFSGPQQQPFVCMTVNQFGIQPHVDSPEPPGFRVFDEAGENVIGYSTNCSIDPFITYFYRTTGGAWVEWPDDGATPSDLALTTTIDGDEVEFVVRVERGTINRFIYSYAMLVDPDVIPEQGGSFDTSRWSGRLLYQFQGGVGIGHTQGRWAESNAMNPDNLGLGYAIAYSTGNRTGEHYNLQVGGETALMTKEHFIKRFGEPLYTVGLGGSGGGIQQYVYGQNHPGLLDAAIPQRSYPDMVTQTIHIGDCELLEHYMDATDRLNTRWLFTDNRSWLVGLNATNLLGNPFLPAQQTFGFAAAPGMTECVPGWRGLSPLVLNPLFGAVRESDKWEPQSDIAAIEWTHMDDLRNIYGVGEDGFARRAVDNVGVQFGLHAFVSGDLSAAEFLNANAFVGGWKPSADIVQEGWPFLGPLTPDNFDPWSRRNMMLSDSAEPAPRHQGNLEAIQALYENGLVFRGRIEMPVLDMRDWMEPVLDMHNSHQSFAARQRILNEMGNADHHVVWFAGIGDEFPFPGVQFDLTGQALLVIDEWMQNILRDPKRRIVKNRPSAAVDTCFTHEGDVIATGDGVWSGILDPGPAGACTETFPIFTTSRIEAGGPITGDVFKCQLKSVENALGDGTYGDRTFTADQIDRLHQIFPDGVCDYSLPDAGRPENLPAG